MIRSLLIVLVSVVILAGCGFTPLHATGGATDTFNNLALIVEQGDDENDRAAGFMIEQRLRDRITDSQAADYALTVTPNIQRVSLGLTARDRATRYDTVMTARWVLVRQSDGAVIGSDVLRETGSFSADEDPYRLLGTDQALQDRTARRLADDIITAVALALEAAQSGPASTAAP